VRRLSLLDYIALAIVILYLVFRIAGEFGRRLPFTSLLGFFTFVAALYFVIRLTPWIRSQLLWRLRNRLIVAYVFIAVVPVLLLLGIAAVASYFLYFQLGAHLLRDHLNEQSAAIQTDADAILNELQAESARGTPVDSAILSRPRFAALVQADRTQWPGLQVFLNRGQHLLNSGQEHFAGLVEFERKLWLAAEGTRATDQGRVSVLVAAPVTSAILDELGSELGPIQLLLLRPVLLHPSPQKPASGFTWEINNASYASSEEITSTNRSLARRANLLDFRVSGGATFDAQHLDAQDGSAPAPVVAFFALRPMMVNRQLFTSVGVFGAPLQLVLTIAAAIFCILEIAALAVGIALTRTITRAVGDLYDATLHVRRGDFGYRIRVQTRDQLGSLGESFNEMTSSISDLIAEQQQRQRLEHEISIAREVQEQLFPRSLPVIPGLQLAGVCRPARSVSGDYYDFIQLAPNRLAIALADISGKGIFAALLMASLQAALRSMTAVDGFEGTASLVARLNNHLFKNTSDDRYATFFFAIYDTESKTITYTNAGHLAPFFVSAGGVQQLDEGGTVVGLFEGASFTERTLNVTPGSVLVVFSDGLTEPENVYGEEFGMQRVKNEILRQRNLPAQRLAENLISAADQWSGTPEQADDITVIVARMG